MDAIEQLLKTTITELKSMVSPQTVFGEPVTVDSTTVIPVVKASFGFGTGGGHGKKGSENGGGGGTGGGANLIPVAFIIIDENGVRVEPLKKNAEGSSSTVNTAVDAIAAVVKKRYKMDEDEPLTPDQEQATSSPTDEVQPE